MNADDSGIAVAGHGNCIYTIRFDGSGGDGASVLHDLLRAFRALEEKADAKAVVVAGTDEVFFRGGRAVVDTAVSEGLYEAVATFPVPVIAAMRGEATGAGFLFGSVCDFMVLSLDGRYGYPDYEDGLYATPEEAALLRDRFGASAVSLLLKSLRPFTGRQLMDLGWTGRIASDDRVESVAHALAGDLAATRRKPLVLLKRHLVGAVVNSVNALRAHPAESTHALPTPLSRRDDLSDSVSEYLQIATHNEEVVCITIRDAGDKSFVECLESDLSEVLFRLAEENQRRAVILAGEGPCLLPESDHDKCLRALPGLQAAVQESPLPIVAVPGRRTSGASWLLAECCDACVYTNGGEYAMRSLTPSPALSRSASRLLRARLGSALGGEIVLTAAEYSGAELGNRRSSLLSADAAEVLSVAGGLAESLSRIPSAAITTLRQVSSGVDGGSSADEAVIEPALDSSVPTEVPFTTRVVSVTTHPEGIIEVQMEDTEAKNMFSDALVEGLLEVFSYIERTANCKVVVLKGYGNYFSSGGTKQTLLDIQEGRTRFTDRKIYQLALDCPIPVIAAMQGHGIGAGWALGMFADVTLFSEESRYVSPYMNYGFTPGAGATLILPATLGNDIGRESLMSAREYSGKELRERNVGLLTTPREQMATTAVDLARRMATNSREYLVAVKKWLNESIRERLSDTYAHELWMHEETFVGQEETLRRIQADFRDGSGCVEGLTQSKIPGGSTGAEQGGVRPTLSDVGDALKEMLAGELHLDPDEIDEQTQFVDLGLDSITGVTWVRLINEKYKTSIEATKVYAYPTLVQLTEHVLKELQKSDKDQDVEVREDNPTGDAFPRQTESSMHDETAAKKPHLQDVLERLKELLSEELHLDTRDIREDRQFVELGLDSVSGVTWTRKINETYRTSLDATTIYTHSTLLMLARRLLKCLPGETQREASALISGEHRDESIQRHLRPIRIQRKSVILKSWRVKEANRPRSRTVSGPLYQPIAVIGMAGKFPMAEDVNRFWENIIGGKDCVREIPPSRWDIDAIYEKGQPAEGKTNSRWLGLLEEYDLFDPLFFNISPTEAVCMDPQQRVFLEACWHCIENAGYGAKALSGSNCGVFVGCGKSDYQLLSRHLQISAHGFLGDVSSILGARIAYYLNLRGPCLSIETACSSSLVSIATACDSLITGGSDLALAGGVYVMAGPEMLIKSAQSGMLSPDGKCYTFDNRANGFVPGEGVGVLMLKRLSDAQRDRDLIYATIQGWGMNQDGKTNGITAPNPESQTRLMAGVYDKFGINPERIGLVEAHGTGTRLGDPIEVEGLKGAFERYTTKKYYCALGSVKSNIGHLLTGAGVAATIKALMSVHKGWIPPTINYETVNEHIDLRKSPFYIADRPKEWNRGSQSERRFAAVSSFGFSGTNAHLVVGEYRRNAADQSERAPSISSSRVVIVPLSARTAQSLRMVAQNLNEFLKLQRRSLALESIAYSLQIGRTGKEKRIAFVVASVDELIVELEFFLSAPKVTGSARWQDETRSGKNRTPEKLTLWDIATSWEFGTWDDWVSMYDENRPEMVRLPNYPFAKDRYWIDDLEGGDKSPDTASQGRIHPLVHTNTSKLSRQAYESTFLGSEFFLDDHRVGGIKVLPGVACLEMVRAALQNAIDPFPEDRIVEIRDTAWLRPFMVTEPRTIGIALYPSNPDDPAVGSIDFEIYGVHGGSMPLHCRGVAGFVDSPRKSLDLDAVRRKTGKGRIDSAQIYQGLDALGLQYGDGHRGVEHVLLGESQVLASLSLPEKIEKTFPLYVLHPCLLDSALQTSIALFPDLGRAEKSPSVPFRLDLLRVYSGFTKRMMAWVRYAPGYPGGIDPIELDIDLCDEAGNICVQMAGFGSRRYQPVAHDNVQHPNTPSVQLPVSFDKELYLDLIHRLIRDEISIEQALEAE